MSPCRASGYRPTYYIPLCAVGTGSAGGAASYRRLAKDDTLITRRTTSATARYPLIAIVILPKHL